MRVKYERFQMKNSPAQQKEDEDGHVSFLFERRKSHTIGQRDFTNQSVTLK